MRLRIAFLSFLLAGLALPASAQVQQVKIGVNGLVCAVCSFSVEKALGKRDDVASAKVDLKDKAVVVAPKPNFAFSPESFRQTIKKAGFQAREFELVVRGRIERNGETYALVLDDAGTRFLLRPSSTASLGPAEGKLVQLRAKVVSEKPAIELEVLDVSPAGE